MTDRAAPSVEVQARAVDLNPPAEAGIRHWRERLGPGQRRPVEPARGQMCKRSSDGLDVQLPSTPMALRCCAPGGSLRPQLPVTDLNPVGGPRRGEGLLDRPGSPVGPDRAPQRPGRGGVGGTVDGVADPDRGRAVRRHRPKVERLVVPASSRHRGKHRTRHRRQAWIAGQVGRIDLRDGVGRQSDQRRASLPQLVSELGVLSGGARLGDLFVLYVLSAETTALLRGGEPHQRSSAAFR